MQGQADSGVRRDAWAIAATSGPKWTDPNHDPSSRRRRFGEAGAAGNMIGGPKPTAQATTRQVKPVCTKRPCTTPGCATWRAHRTWAPPFAPAPGQARSQKSSRPPFLSALPQLGLAIIKWSPT